MTRYLTILVASVIALAGVQGLSGNAWAQTNIGGSLSTDRYGNVRGGHLNINIGGHYHHPSHGRVQVVRAPMYHQPPPRQHYYVQTPARVVYLVSARTLYVDAVPAHQVVRSTWCPRGNVWSIDQHGCVPTAHHHAVTTHTHTRTVTTHHGRHVHGLPPAESRLPPGYSRSGRDIIIH